jgi:Tol biopolymer transport system component
VAHGQQEPAAIIEPWTFGPIGTIAAPHGAGVLLTDVATGAERQLAVMPPVGVSGHAAWSPDRTRLAISRFGRQPGERVGGSDILVVPAAGGEAQTVALHDADGALLGAPAWLPDSSGLYYDHLPPSGEASSGQVRFAPLSPTGSARAISVGGWPAVSADGRLLAFVRPSPTTGYLNELVVMDASGLAPRTLVPVDHLVQITSPRFSPDGNEIAFIGSVSVGEELELSVPADLTGLFQKVSPFTPDAHRGVLRHGPPGDVWVMSLLGGTPARLTFFEEDEPTLAWSPDGYWLAMMGGGGLYVLPRDLSQVPRQVGKGGFGGIDWR